MKTHPKGIYTLANDNVIDQLIALLNSIEANYSKTIPICVIPYDDNIKKVKEEIGKRKNVFLFDDKNSIRYWEDFAIKAWELNKNAKEQWKKHDIKVINRLNEHRKFCIFDGPFRTFVFFDSDILVMNSLDKIFKSLKKFDLVIYDFQHKDPSHVYNMRFKNLYNIFSKDSIAKQIFCTGFFATKKQIFGKYNRNSILRKLRKEAEILYPWSADQPLLNYIVMKSNWSVCNYTFKLPENQTTGNAVVSKHFTEKNHILYDKGNRLTYLHYIRVPYDLFPRVCAGENLDFPYRDIFLYYRFMKEPDKMPVFKGKPKPYGQKSLQQILMTKFRNLKHKLLKIITQK
jgi:hypothetical protein